MNKYVIFADSNCDIDKQTLKGWGAEYIPLSYVFDGEEKTYLDGEITNKEFYDMIREGKTAHTSALNSENLRRAFTPTLESGADCFYCTFSSGLSSTYSVAKMTAAELEAEFPGRRVKVVDSLCESAGYGLLMYAVLKKAQNGISMDELEQFILDNRLNISHRFTVDDLKYLKRGGRISPTVAFAGTLLGIKPLLHMDDEGKLVSIGKVRGRRASIEALADAFGKTKVTNEPIFISHADCLDDALLLEKLLKEKYGASVRYIAEIGAVIGAHCGPGTLAVFFFAKER